MRKSDTPLLQSARRGKLVSAAQQHAVSIIAVLISLVAVWQTHLQMKDAKAERISADKQQRDAEMSMARVVAANEKLADAATLQARASDALAATASGQLELSRRGLSAAYGPVIAIDLISVGSLLVSGDTITVGATYKITNVGNKPAHNFAPQSRLIAYSSRQDYVAGLRRVCSEAQSIGSQRDQELRPGESTEWGFDAPGKIADLRDKAPFPGAADQSGAIVATCVASKSPTDGKWRFSRTLHEVRELDERGVIGGIANTPHRSTKERLLVYPLPFGATTTEGL